MELSVGAFNDLLAEMGQRVLWRRAEFCPCRSSTSGAALLNCVICNGKGVFWLDGVGAWAGMTGMKVARAWQDAGLYEAGDVVNTLPSDSPMYSAGENDRVQMLDATEPFHALLTHDGTDKVPYFVREIDRVFGIDQPSKQVFEYGIPTQNSDGSFTWISGEPPAGAAYSMRGRRRPEYFLFKDFPQDRSHFEGMALPRRVILRKFDLFGR